MNTSRTLRLLLLLWLVVGISSSPAQTKKEPKPTLQEVDQDLREAREAEAGMAEGVALMQDALQKAKSGNYLILAPLTPVRKSFFDTLMSYQVIGRIMEAANPTQPPLFYRETRFVKEVVKFTKWFIKNGDWLLKDIQEALQGIRDNIADLERQREKLLAQRDEERKPTTSTVGTDARWVRKNFVANPEDRTSPEHSSIGGGYIVDKMTATEVHVKNKGLNVESAATATEPPESFRGSFQITMTVTCNAGKAEYCCFKAGISCSANHEPKEEVGDCGKKVKMTQTYTIAPAEGTKGFTFTSYVRDIGVMATCKYELE
jgi:hypothetical protein